MAGHEAIEFYGWWTTNPQKVGIMIAETGLAHIPRAVNLDEGKQQAPAYLALNLHSKVPTLVDPAGPGGDRLVLTEPCAILLYLAEKTGMLLVLEPQARTETLRWLYLPGGERDPGLQRPPHLASPEARGQRGGAGARGSDLSCACRVLEKRLGEADYLAGAYSIADNAHVPHVARHVGVGELKEYRNMPRWLDRVTARPAVETGLSAFAD